MRFLTVLPGLLCLCQSPHINFITGENGSGKSAIIAAIQVHNLLPFNSTVEHAQYSTVCG